MYTIACIFLFAIIIFIFDYFFLVFLAYFFFWLNFYNNICKIMK